MVDKHELPKQELSVAQLDRTGLFGVALRGDYAHTVVSEGALEIVEVETDPPAIQIFSVKEFKGDDSSYPLQDNCLRFIETEFELDLSPERPVPMLVPHWTDVREGQRRIWLEAFRYMHRRKPEINGGIPSIDR